MSTGAQQEARGIGVNLLTLFAQASLPAFHVQLARALGESGYGVYRTATTFVDVLSVITMFGMDLAITRRVSIARAANDEAGAVAAVGTALRVVLLSGLAVSLLVFVSAPSVAAWQQSPQLVTPLRTLVLLPIAYHVASIFLIATQARMVMRYDFWARGLFQPLVLLGATTLVLRLGGGIVGACFAVVTGMAATSLLAGRFYSRELPLGPTLAAIVRNPMDWGLVRMGLPGVVLGIVWGLQGSVDTLFLGHYRGSADVGAYGACVLYVVSLSQVRGAFYPVIAATLPPMLVKGDKAATNEFIRRQTRWVALLAMPLCVLFAGFGDGLLAIFGGEFLRAAPALAILSLGHLTGALAVPAYVLLLGGKARYSTIAALTCLVFQLVALPILVPRYGLIGAAVSSASGMALSQVVQLGFAWSIERVHGFSVGLAKVAVAALAGFVCGRGLFQWMPYPLIVRFFVGVAVAALVYATVLVSLGLREDEREMVGAGWQKVRARLSRD